MIARASSLCLLALGLAACSSGSDRSPPKLDAGRTRRVIEPPTGTVRPLPPHAIDPGGVGPYRLGVTQAAVLAATVPRSETLEIEEVVDAIVVPVEDETILLGGRPGEPISFIAALAKGIVRTETGLGVGARRAELSALGPHLADPRSARDPRIVTPAAMPGARFLLENEIVAAVLLRAPGGSAPGFPQDAGAPPDPIPGDVGGGAPECAASLPASETDVLAVAGLKGVARVFPACMTASGREALVVAGDVIVVVDTDGAKARRVAKEELPGLVWAAPLRFEPDRDDIVAITERRDGHELVLTLHALRLEGGKLTRLVPGPGTDVYQVSETEAQWIGARVEDLRLLLTVDAGPDGYQVGGVLLHLGGNLERAVRNVAPLLPVQVERKRGRTGSEPAVPATAPPRDASPPSHDAGVVAPRDL